MPTKYEVEIPCVADVIELPNGDHGVYMTLPNGRQVSFTLTGDEARQLLEEVEQ